MFHVKAIGLVALGLLLHPLLGAAILIYYVAIYIHRSW